jgi:aminopeptidase
MDPRVEEHARVLVEHCVDVQRGDAVQVAAPASADDLVAAVYEELGRRGARPMLSWLNYRAVRRLARAMDPDEYTTPPHRLAAMEETDAVVMIAGDVNASELSDVPGAALGAAQRANEPVVDERPDRWVFTRHPTPAQAQQAGMSTEAYADFVYDAVNRDWTEQREFQQRLVDVLDPADEVRVVAGDETDVRMSISGMRVVNDYGETNMPGGEVFTAPVPESVEGTVRFDVPVMVFEAAVRDAFLRFEGGEVVAFEAAENEGALADVLDTDAGAPASANSASG